MTTATSAKKGILRHPQDLHCVVYHLLTVAAYVVAFWLWLNPELSGLTDWVRKTVFVITAAPLLGWIGGIDVGVNYHNHSHIRVFHNAFLNRWFGRTWTLTAGWPEAHWKYLHVTVHHAYLLQERDWTVARRLPGGGVESSLSYQLKQWPWRTAYNLVRDVRLGWFPKKRAIVEFAWFLLFWSIPFVIDPVMGLCLWLLPHWCANCITMNRGMYVQHAGCEAFPANPKAPHSNPFPLPFFNATMFNIGYHGEHHDYPGVHWSELPKLYRSLQQGKVSAEMAAAREDG